MQAFNYNLMLFTPIKIAIVDDHALFRKILKGFLSEQSNLNVSFQASDVFDLLEKLKKHPTDILLMDLFLPEINGKDALKIIRNEYPELRVLILSMSTDMGEISELLDMGIHGYISKAEEPEELLKAINVVAENRIYRNRLFTEALYWSKQNNIKSVFKVSPNDLSQREKRILQLIWEEKSNKEMADELYLGVRSVEKIRQDMKEKIGVKSTIGLLKYGINHHLIGVAGVKSPGLI